jgi:hypothetical protein
MPKGKEIPKRVGVAIKEGSTRLVLVNNQSQQMFHTYYLHCPDCGRAVYSIDSTPDNLVESVKALVPQMVDNATYCPKCGQKLSYSVLDIIEGEYTENNKVYPDNPPQPEVKPEVKEENVEQQENKEKQ